MSQVSASHAMPDASSVRRAAIPKLGFLGVGWIGLNRMEALATAGVAEIAAIADSSPEMLARAKHLAPEARVSESLEVLLENQLDGLVIATPSALHARQAEAALNLRLPVFCQKPLGRNGAETRQVIAAARRADALLGVDLSYRRLAGANRIRDLINTGALGEIYAV